MAQMVEFSTKDNMVIIGDFYEADGSGAAALLLHMMPADRKSWVDFAASLEKVGLSSLAIDLRGHGESQGGPAGFKGFTDKEHQASIEDVEAAVLWLRGNGFEKIALVGASIGANLALWYLAERAGPEIKSAILLSPGLDYRGIKTEPPALKLAADKNIYIVSEMAEDAQKIFNLTKSGKKLKICKDRFHGTDILRENPDLEDELTRWVKKNI